MNICWTLTPLHSPKLKISLGTLKSFSKCNANTASIQTFPNPIAVLSHELPRNLAAPFLHSQSWIWQGKLQKACLLPANFLQQIKSILKKCVNLNHWHHWTNSFWLNFTSHIISVGWLSLAPDYNRIILLEYNSISRGIALQHVCSGWQRCDSEFNRVWVLGCKNIAMEKQQKNRIHY